MTKTYDIIARMKQTRHMGGPGEEASYNYDKASIVFFEGAFRNPVRRKLKQVGGSIYLA